MTLKRPRCTSHTARIAAAGLGLIALISACGATPSQAASGTIAVVAAENEYGNVAAQIGGTAVTVTSVQSNPNTDPHTYEVSTSVAEEVGAAQLVIENGVGYDNYMSKILSASSSPTRTVVNVQHLLGLPDSTPNPHLWYDPATMPKVANALVAAYAALKPADAAYFTANATRFIASLNPWLQALASFKSQYPGTPVATTEPVADYMLQAAGSNNLTPFRFQADIMNGVDPAPQDVSLETGLFTQHKVKALVYNQQVTDTLTQTFISAAQSAKIPVIGVYETMPTPGYTYQSWMLAEVTALRNAVADGISTQHL
jgi:zinc/manganese transport system substrate-binding protein